MYNSANVILHNHHHLLKGLFVMIIVFIGGRKTWPYSVLVYDGDNSHRALIEELGLSSEVHPTSEAKGVKDRDNPLRPINHVHGLIKSFMGSHPNFGRDGLQDWMNLLSFILSAPFEAYMKIEKFLRITLSEPNLVRYRAFYRKKCDK